MYAAGEYWVVLGEIGSSSGVLEGSSVDYQELQDSDDEKLLQLVFAYETSGVQDGSQLSAEAMATLMLRNRGYEFQDDGESLTIVDEEGTEIGAEDV